MKCAYTAVSQPQIIFEEIRRKRFMWFYEHHINSLARIFKFVVRHQIVLLDVISMSSTVWG